MTKKNLRKLIENLIKQQLTDNNYSLNCANTPLETAVKYASEQFENAGKDLYTIIPDFDENYKKLQKYCKSALDIPRIDMPVIEPNEMKEFDNSLKKGHIDIFKPHVKKELFPTKLNKQTGKNWLTLGIQDGDKLDDIINGKWTKVPATNLKPTQSQIWLENIIPNIIKFGVPSNTSPIAKATLIISKEGYILDGHHRYGQAIIANPNLKMNVLYIPLDINTLVKMSRSYGNAIGNKAKA
jgi:hypothetical protein